MPESKIEESESATRARAIRDTLKAVLAVSHEFLQVADRFGNFPFHYWCSINGSDVEIFIGLENRIIGSNLSGWGPIHLASFHINIPLLKELLSKRMLLDTENRVTKPNKKEKRTHKIFDVNDTIKVSGKTALMIACEKGYEEVVDLLLLDENLDFSVRDNTVGTALEWACEFGHSKICRKLIEHGFAKIDMTNNNKVRLLQSACYYGEELSALIFELWYDWVSADEDGNTPLHVACGKGFSEAAQ